MLISFIISEALYQIVMDSKIEKGEKLDFYMKLKKEYEKAAKPFIYEFSFSEQPKHKKFRILLGKFVEILKDGMKDEYRFQEGNAGNYWNQLQKKFANKPEMKFIIQKVYEVAEKKIRIFFALLIHTHDIFKVLEAIFKELPYLYIDINRKLKNYETEANAINFLRDGQAEVDSTYVKDYQAWLEKIVMMEILTKNTITDLLKEMVEAIDEQIKNEELLRLQEQKRKKEEEQLAKKQEEDDRRRKLQQKPPPSRIPQVKPAVNIQPDSNKQIPVVISQKQIGGYDKYFQSTPTPIQPTPLELKMKPKHLKNSEFLFTQRYKDELQVFHYQPRPNPSEKKTECFECKQPLSQGFYIFGSNLNYCNYFGEWYCNDHTAEQRVQIPYKAREQFDLRGYTVSKTGYERIKRYFEKPIIQITYEDPIVKRTKRLYDFMILRRQIHLMYDSICNSELMDKMLRGRLNYCLKRNLFSLKNLYDIYNGHETTHLEGEYSILSKHFYRCETCQDRKGRLCAVCNHPPKIFAFELRDTFSCERCLKISHRRCLAGNKCLCE